MNIVETLTSNLEKYFQNQSCGHDIYHAKRVLLLAEKIHQTEGGDWEVISVAALVHDMYRPWEKETGKSHFGEEALQMMNVFLEEYLDSKDTIMKVLEVVRYHDIYDWSDKNQSKTVELQVVQDADNLDAIGAIGIARCFAYGGAHGLELYSPSDTLEFQHDYVESPDKKESAISHFHEKLLKLKDNMNTASGRKIAQERHAFMELFLKQFFSEWNLKSKLT